VWYENANGTTPPSIDVELNVVELTALLNFHFDSRSTHTRSISFMYVLFRYFSYPVRAHCVNNWSINRLLPGQETVHPHRRKPATHDA
jgi:hypothetical protein